jgi:outer membrane protein
MQRHVLVSLAAVASLAMCAIVPVTAYGQGTSPTTSPARPAPSQSAAPASGGAKIAFISSQTILQATPGYATAESTFIKERTAAQSEVQKLQQQLDSAVQLLDQQSLALSPAARAQRQKDLQAMQARMEQRGNELQDRLQQRQQELFGPLNARVRAVIEGIRAEMNYSLILDADAPGGLVAAVDPALNITARVLQRLSQAQ